MSIEVVDNLFQSVTERTHTHDNAICIGSAIVIKQVIAGAKLPIDLVHIALNNGRKLSIGSVAGLTMLEEDITIFMRTTSCWMLWIESMITEFLDSITVKHGC